MVPVTSLRPGVTFEEHGEIFEVLTYNNMHLRKTSSVVQVKVRSLRKGSTTEKSFGSNGQVNPVKIEKRELARVSLITFTNFHMFSFARMST
jgi:translation elongation factor P/translation initiation factor 5A